jgi:hypothetical protein
MPRNPALASSLAKDCFKKHIFSISAEKLFHRRFIILRNGLLETFLQLEQIVQVVDENFLPFRFFRIENVDELLLRMEKEPADGFPVIIIQQNSTV